ncbi:MAG: YdhR family protein [Caldilineales bacterium]|nr:YdhR family protein [Caldilineales bacterium]MCW5858229.1 YdhR family protein [Caldilineales bacterium]
MSQTILQINFTFTGVSGAELQESWLPAAQLIADTPGLRWKVWLINEAQRECGGIYLFDDETAVQGFLNSPLVAAVQADPRLSNASVKLFDIMAAHTVITRGPVGAGAAGGNGALKTFGGMAQEAFQAVPAIKPADLQRRQKREPDLLVIDVRDAADIAQTGTVPGAANISYGSLTYMADHEVPESWRDPRLADRARPIVTTCILGPLGGLGGKLLHDMGFTNVQILEGGVQAWIEAGLPVAKNGGS